MSRDASITLDWAGGTSHFRLGWGELAKLQEACDAGPFVVLERLNSGACRLEDISGVIRWGLIGGGLPPVDAAKTVRLFVEGVPPADNRLTAYAVLSAACYGAPEEGIEKKSAAPDRDDVLTTSHEEKSGSERSTDSAQS